MAEFHFRSMEAPQSESDVTNRFGDRDFILAVCTCFLCNSDCFEVMAENPIFPVTSQKKAMAPFNFWLAV
jgi:hypothetical protein